MSSPHTATNLCWVIVGAGGHGLVVADCIQAAGMAIAGFLDDTAQKSVAGLPVLGTTDLLSRVGELYGVNAACIAIGANAVRMTVSIMAAEYLPLPPCVHPTAYISPYAQLEDGVYVGPMAVVHAGAIVGRGAIINTAASVDHHCHIGAWAHIGPGAHLSGSVHVGEGALLGAGACARPGASVGAWAIVGAGGVVVEAVPEHCVATGCPARPCQAATGREEAL